MAYTKTKTIPTPGFLAKTAMAVALSAALALSFAPAFGSSSEAYASEKASSGVAMKLSAAKNGLVKKGGSYYFYKNGKKVKKAWVKVKSAKYYFQANGKAAVGSCKVKGSYYIFNAKGKLATGSKTRVVTVKGVKYQANKKGKAVAGWASGNASYFKKNGTMAKDEVVQIGAQSYGFDSNGSVIKGLGLIAKGKYDFIFCASSPDGVYDAARSNQLNAFTKYEQPCEGLFELLGTPKSKSDNPSCNCINGEDGVDVFRNYDGFKLVTFCSKSGKEYFMYLERA